MLGVVLIAVSMSGAAVSWYWLADLRRLHALALNPPTPADAPAPPAAPPLTGEMLPPTGLPQVDRRAVTAAVGRAAKNAFTADREYLLDLLLAERGRDLLGGVPTPAAVEQMRVVDTLGGPDTVSHDLPGDRMGTLDLTCPGGRVTLNNATVTMVDAAGATAEVRGSLFVSGRKAWPPGPVVEAELDRASAAAGVVPTAAQAATVYAAARGGLVGKTDSAGWALGLQAVGGGTLSVEVPDSASDVVWVLVDGSSVRLPRGSEPARDPVTGRLRNDPAARPPIPLAPAWGLWLLGYVELGWAAAGVVLAAMFVLDARGGRVGLVAWCVGRVVVTLVTVVVANALLASGLPGGGAAAGARGISSARSLGLWVVIGALAVPLAALAVLFSKPVARHAAKLAAERAAGPLTLQVRYVAAWAAVAAGLGVAGWHVAAAATTS
ncbi:MAG TPA: hypothetical protein VF796_17110, partial [Humisphaera sp.]